MCLHMERQTPNVVVFLACGRASLRPPAPCTWQGPEDEAHLFKMINWQRGMLVTVSEPREISLQAGDCQWHLSRLCARMVN